MEHSNLQAMINIVAASRTPRIQAGKEIPHNNNNLEEELKCDESAAWPCLHAPRPVVGFADLPGDGSS